MQFGRYYEEFEVGAVYRHWPGKTVTEYDDHLFCLLTMNHHPLHMDAHYAETASQFKRNVVVGNYIYSLLLGMSVPDVSGKAIANLEVESLRHVAPTFHGDTIYGETTVLDKRESGSKPDRGVVSVETRGYNQDGTMVCVFRRRVMVPKREYAASAVPEGVDPERPSFPSRAERGVRPRLLPAPGFGGEGALFRFGAYAGAGGSDEPLRRRRAALCRPPSRTLDHRHLLRRRVGPAHQPARSGHRGRRRARPRPPGPGVAAGLAGLEAVAAGRAFDSDLVRAVVAAIYARDDGNPPPVERLTDLVDLLAACRAAVRVLHRRADPADSAAYRQWVQSVAARVCRAVPAPGERSAGQPTSPADRRFLDRLGGALGLV
ncbi:hypothetical protein GCM10027614_40220 [Micromonospora vulcania]